MEYAKSAAMKPVGPLLASVFLLGLGAPALAAEDLHSTKGDLPKSGADDQAKPAEPAECPIKKTVDGKTYCFQNDPALTKPQGGN